jgi:hypothetical protein
MPNMVINSLMLPAGLRFLRLPLRSLTGAVVMAVLVTSPFSSLGWLHRTFDFIFLVILEGRLRKAAHGSTGLI